MDSRKDVVGWKGTKGKLHAQVVVQGVSLSFALFFIFDMNTPYPSNYMFHSTVHAQTYSTEDDLVIKCILFP